MNEEFYKDLGYENVKTEEELKEEIKKHLLEHKKLMLKTNTLMNYLRKQLNL